eukprot:scaffold14079_cov42-Prasinocladus_malaysianus.AAC.1
MAELDNRCHKFIVRNGEHSNILNGIISIAKFSLALRIQTSNFMNLSRNLGANIDCQLHEP